MNSKKTHSDAASELSSATPEELRKRLIDIVYICDLDRRQPVDEFLEKRSPDDQYLRDFLTIKQRLGTRFDAVLKSVLGAMPQIRQEAYRNQLFRERSLWEDDDDYAERVDEQRRYPNPWGD